MAVASPSNPKLVGTNKIGLMDPNGVPIIATARDIARDKGSGFFRYMYAKPGETKLGPKLTLVQALTPSGSLFALSGIYIDDVDAAMRRQGILLGEALLTVVLLVSGMSVLFNVRLAVDCDASAMPQIWLPRCVRPNSTERGTRLILGRMQERCVHRDRPADAPAYA